MFAPLSTALDGAGDARRVAAADYPGWQRWVRSSATRHEQNYGTRFVPARPAVSVYDGQGKLLRRFGPELFPRPAWLDLAFFDDLVIGKGQDNRVLVLLGGRKGLDLGRSVQIALDYRLHYETGLYVGDFDGDGSPSLACLGYTNTGVGAGGPLAVYIRRLVSKP